MDRICTENMFDFLGKEKIFLKKNPTYFEEMDKARCIGYERNAELENCKKGLLFSSVWGYDREA